jgi:cytosine/adenosine deaminase-related metal-dependent hydrolase
MSEFTLRARWVLPIDRPPIEGGYVSHAGGRITAIGASAPNAGAVEDLGDVVLMPGLVNAHTHLEFSDLVAPLGEPGMPLPAWIRLVIGERKRGQRDPAAAIAAGFAESLASGVTSVGEISTAAADAYAVAAARPTIVSFQESIGFSAQRVDSALADVQQRFERAPRPAGFSPHAPYTVHPRLLERIVASAITLGAPVAMHLAESREELQLLAEGAGDFADLLDERSMWDPTAISRGTRPMDYLSALAKAPRSLVIHGNYLAADEITLLGARRDRMSIVYCPRTHAFFGHEPYPLSQMLLAGARVVLGTDSRASNPDLDMLAEIRAATARHPDVSGADFLEMATLSAAEALGIGQDVGSLTPGKRADLIALPCTSRDPIESILDDRTRVARVWLAGQVVTPS